MQNVSISDLNKLLKKLLFVLLTIEKIDEQLDQITY